VTDLEQLGEGLHGDPGVAGLVHERHGLFDDLAVAIFQSAGPSMWLKVVVAFDEDTNTGIVRTAFPRRTKP
jgi:hypothetical protein